MDNVLDTEAMTVSLLTATIKQLLESSYPSVCVQGEISNCKPHQSGHWYFTLKDEQAQIGAVMFRSEASRLDFAPTNGDKVLVEGALNVYPAGGKYQIIVREMQKQGLGKLLLLLEELKQKILKRGWFKKEHKKPLPFLPHKIGVVTSPTGAVIQDMLHILTRRNHHFHLILYPAKVQGDGAAVDIARGIDFFNQHCPVDVIIVGRGGGSFEDLWCFNEEIVAGAIFHSHIPVVCAVGHETDHCIAEYVADARAPTPSAAAELVMAEHVQLSKRLEQIQMNLRQALIHHLQKARSTLTSLLRHPVFASPYYLLGKWIQRLDELQHRLDSAIEQKINRYQAHLQAIERLLRSYHPSSKLSHFRQLLQQKQQSCEKALQNKIFLYKQKLASLQQTLNAIDPTHLLNKGFSILFDEKDGSVITNANQLQIDDRIKVRLATGSLLATINKVNP